MRAKVLSVSTTNLPKPTVTCKTCKGTALYHYASGGVGACSRCEGGFRYTRQDAVVVSRVRIEKNLVGLRTEYRAAVARLQEAKDSGRMVLTAERGVAMALANGKTARAALELLSTVSAFDASVRQRMIDMGYSPNVVVH